MLSPCLAFSSWHLISSTTGTLSSPHRLSQFYLWSQACFSTLLATLSPSISASPLSLSSPPSARACWQHHHPVSLHLRRF